MPVTLGTNVLFRTMYYVALKILIILTMLPSFYGSDKELKLV